MHSRCRLLAQLSSIRWGDTALTEDEFWYELRFRCYSEVLFKGTTLSSDYCDWFDPKRYSFGDCPFEVSGTVGFLSGGRSTEEWRFTLTTRVSFSSFAEIHWSGLLPSGNGAIGIAVDAHARSIRIDLP